MRKLRPILIAGKTTMNGNDLRQCLRMALGGTLGFLLCKLMNWNYGAFFTVMPIFLLGMVPRLVPHVIRQYLGAVLLVVPVILLVQGVFGDKPVPMTLLMMALFALLFREMSRGVNLLFGALGVVSLSMMLNFASYPGANVADIIASFLMSTATTLLICNLMHILLPDVEPRAPRPAFTKTASSRRHEVILATTVATLSFVTFQVFDLPTSLSAQIASLLVVFPMSWRGAIPSAWNRTLGTLVGCNAGLVIQFILMTHFDVLPFITLGLWLSLLIFGRYHMLEGGPSGAGFAAVTTMAILFGQYVTPERDLFFSDLYRFSSLAVAVLISLMVVFLMDRLLNRFESTRWEAPA